ncbi:hypothetical protein MAR_019144 [Mya arenaria]|uniref:RING-type domain-containing protein n=1 Tax=Mya arenaria TaxID=6604 RepID=A0ABY7EK97_MYAAR|nr:hypothetical protein MAR_019144 [Mya arenaria]
MPFFQIEHPWAVTVQALAEFGYSESEAKIALNIFKNRNATSDREFVLRENQRLKEYMICKICKNKLCDTVFLPCGHRVSCWGCASLWEKSCFHCWKPLNGAVRILDA